MERNKVKKFVQFCIVRTVQAIYYSLILDWTEMFEIMDDDQPQTSSAHQSMDSSKEIREIFGKIAHSPVFGKLSQKVSFMNRKTDNSQIRSTPAGQRWTGRVPVRNPLELPLALADLSLEWSPGEETGIDAQVVERIVLGPKETKNVWLSLNLREEMAGKKLKIRGVKFGLGTLLEDGRIDRDLLVYGRQDINVRGR